MGLWSAPFLFPRKFHLCRYPQKVSLVSSEWPLIMEQSPRASTNRQAPTNIGDTHSKATLRTKYRTCSQVLFKNRDEVQQIMSVNFKINTII